MYRITKFFYSITDSRSPIHDMMNVLLTNDDGIDAAGIQALIEGLSGPSALPEFPEPLRLLVVAPANEKSACSHSISLGEKLRIEESRAGAVPFYKVHGTPADCVKFALAEIKDFVPDLILSGINQGANTGVSVYYSGTISAAREGFINRVPSAAISLCSKNSKDFAPAISITKKLIEGYQACLFPLDVMLNVNVPALGPGEIKGIKITKQAASRFIEEFVPEDQHDGKKVYELAGQIELYDPDGESDEEAVAKGFISITPLKLDLTAYEAMSAFEKWARNGRYNSK